MFPPRFACNDENASHRTEYSASLFQQEAYIFIMSSSIKPLPAVNLFLNPIQDLNLSARYVLTHVCRRLSGINSFVRITPGMHCHLDILLSRSIYTVVRTYLNNLNSFVRSCRLYRGSVSHVTVRGEDLRQGSSHPPHCDGRYQHYIRVF